MANRKQQRAPKGSGLSFQPDRGPCGRRGERLGEWVWRRKHPKTGKRLARRTGQHLLANALRVAADFEDELRQELAGVLTYDDWKVELEPLVEEWLAEHEGSETRKQTLGRQVRRCLSTLGLQRAADLCDLPALTKKLRALEGSASRQSLRRSWQDPLRAFSRWLAEDGRYLARDPLANWKLLSAPKRVGEKPRAAPPRTMARALRALDVLDRRHKRKAPQRPFWTALLVGGARVSALIERDVGDLVTRQRFEGGELVTLSRVDLGPGRGNKRRGDCQLDPSTTREVLEALGKRKAGPLFLGSYGGRISRERAADAWEEAYGLALVDELWPARFSPDLETAVQVCLALRRGKVQVSRGGNPRLLSPEKAIERLERHKVVASIAEEIRQEWEARRVTPHRLRMTHETWAKAQRVLGVVIDRQLGHSAAARGERDDLERVLAGSRLARDRYTDEKSQLFDSTLSAIAVRELLDEASATLEQEGTAILFPIDRLERLERASG